MKRSKSSLIRILVIIISVLFTFYFTILVVHTDLHWNMTDQLSKLRLEESFTEFAKIVKENASGNAENRLSTTTTTDGIGIDRNNKTKAPTQPLMPDGGICRCKLGSWPKPELSDHFLSVTHPWFNISEEESIRRHHPNLPLETFKRAITGKICHLMPSLFRIEWADTYWQVASMEPDPPFHLYSAFYDNRSRAGGPSLRILIVTKDKSPKLPYCHLWFNTTGPAVVSGVSEKDFLDYRAVGASRMLPFLLTCPIPPSVAGQVPEAVSVVKRPCEVAANVLKVIGAKDRDQKTAFVNGTNQKYKDKADGWAVAVCSTGLHYFHEDMSLRLIEWLEILKALGVSEVIFHLTDVHPKIIQVLAHYEQEGFISVIDFTYPGPYLNERGLRKWWVQVARSSILSTEKIYFNDCLLRNMHKYRFIAHHDPDEIPIFKKHASYPDVVSHLLRTNKEGTNPTHYKMKWYIHHEDVGPGEAAKALPPFLWFLRHNQRSKVPVPSTPGKFKSLFDMEYVKGVLSHHPRYCLQGECHQRILPKNETYLAHFRRNCNDECRSSGVEEENALLKYAKTVKERVSKVMEKLGLNENYPNKE